MQPRTRANAIRNVSHDNLMLTNQLLPILDLGRLPMSRATHKA